MTFDLDTFKEFLNANHFITYKVFDGFVTEQNLKGKMPMQTRTERNADADQNVNVEVLEFLNRHQGKFTFILGTAKKMHLTNCSRILVDTSPAMVVETPKANPGQNAQMNLTFEQIQDKIDAAVNAELTRREEEREREEMKRKYEELQTMNGKAAHFVNTLLTEFVATNFPAFAAIKQTQTTAAAGSVMNGTETQNDNITNEQRLEQALTILVETFGENTLINLAVKIKKGDAAQYIPLISNFANT